MPVKLPAFSALLGFCLLLSPVFGRAADIQVALDRNPVNLNESFLLMFTTPGEPDGEPDFSPLTKQFSLLHQEQSDNSSWVNGKSSHTRQWTLTLMAKMAGDLQIPAIHFGKDVAPPLAVQVLDGSSNPAVAADKDIFLQAEASPSTPYLQAQTIYTLRVYTRVDIARAQLSDPELADAVVEKLGDDSNFDTQINGVAYSVTERKYAVFPQTPGKLTIKPLVLTAEVLTGGRSMYNGLFSSQVAKAVRVESPAVVLDVKPLPSEVLGQNWLPAEHLELSQEWSGDIRQIKVGEPITRTLTLNAKAVTVGQLPELGAGQASDQVKMYPDQPVLKESKNAAGLTAFRQEKVALIAAQPGNYTLPAIKVTWFDTHQQKMRIAALPETAVTVVAPAAKPNSAATGRTAAVPVNATDTPAKPADSGGFWPGLSAFLALGWIVTLVSIGLRRTVVQTAIEPDTSADDTQRMENAVRHLKKACAENDAMLAKQALLAWGKQQFHTHSLGAMAGFCEARLRDEILHLDAVLYGKHPVAWEGKRLFQAFSENQARSKLASKSMGVLEPLHRI